MRILSFASSIISICLTLGCDKAKFSSVEPKSPDANSSNILTGTKIKAQPEQKLVHYRDQFLVAGSAFKADILLDLDNSGSMKADLLKLAQKLDGFLTVLDDAGIDWQICYITTDVSRSYTAGRARLWYTGSTVLRPETPLRGEIFFKTLSRLPRDGSADEQGIAAIKLAVLRNPECFRPDATLTTIIVSDEDERSCGGRCKAAKGSENSTGTQRWPAVKYYEQYQPLTEDNDPNKVSAFIEERLRGPYPRKTFINHSIVIREKDQSCFDKQDQESQAFYGMEYSKLAKLTGGIVGDICARSFAEQLKAMGRQTIETVNSFPLKCSPQSAPVVSLQPGVHLNLKATYAGNKLKLTPAIPAGMQVTLDYDCLENSNEILGAQSTRVD